ncbi:two-component system, NarL family, sensor histidine kinase DesK [Nocardioides scoriae]|uniref:Two-component system, NarL family, sensor histidine kinase DesK n=1 Tax=Nocardioides scoriae TaxID=642780 RepID=A0A1H1RH03_9ACTN|nr:histidine kinase [Nocardioides scoriae]SDS34933.1 two-component system, NarL family, sensor histidine kinase DesK [Nocardioides scoriae]
MSGALSHVPGWARRSDVERVDVYTRGSLYVVYWFLLASGLLGAAARLGDTPRAAVVSLGVLALGVAGTLVMRHGLDRGAALPGTSPVEGAPTPVAPLLAVAVVAAALAAWAVSLPRQPGTAVAVIAVGALGWSCGAVADRRLHWLALVASAVTLAVVAGTPFMALYGLGLAGFFLFTVQSSIWLLGVVTELDRGRRTTAALAVAEERLRFSRDVHDVLGRRLSTIAVQAELAATLAERGDPRSAERILEVRGTAHDALREARELARGYRPLDLSHELEGAVSLLRSAGIAAEADLAGLPEAWHEPVARVVREAVTNVLRHSSATRVRIAYAGGEVVVEDDGRAGTTVPGDGTGLTTLRDDLAPMGAVVSASGGDVGFVVRVRLDATTPAEVR